MSNSTLGNPQSRPRAVVDLDNPTHCVLVEVHKNIVGISVVQGYEREGKNWNIQLLGGQGPTERTKETSDTTEVENVEASV
jgi:hypothetical protein